MTRTTTYKTTQSDINAGHVTNAAYATGSFNSQPIISPNAIAIVHEQAHGRNTMKKSAMVTEITTVDLAMVVMAVL